jgi:hypothetical protein
MVLRASASSAQLFVHTLLPSAISLAVCPLIGLIFVGAHTLILSASGIAYPNSTNDVFMLFYANHIIQPIASALNNGALNSGLTIMLWGLAGLAAHAIIAAIVNGTSQWRTTEHDVAIPNTGVVVRHPLEHSLFSRAAWRLCIIILAIAFTLLILPVVRWSLSNDWRILAEIEQFPQVLWLALSTILVWAAILYGYLVLLRLYLFRTRVFAELLY